MTDRDDDFTEAVMRVLLALDPGDVMAYGEVATEAGYPGAARADQRDHGPISDRTPLGLPWWRVVNAAGRLAPGNEREQAERLRAEGVKVVKGRVAT